jgi:hypothetical protein
VTRTPPAKPNTSTPTATSPDSAHQSPANSAPVRIPLRRAPVGPTYRALSRRDARRHQRAVHIGYTTRSNPASLSQCLPTPNLLISNGSASQPTHDSHTMAGPTLPGESPSIAAFGAPTGDAPERQRGEQSWLSSSVRTTERDQLLNQSLPPQAILPSGGSCLCAVMMSMTAVQVCCAARLATRCAASRPVRSVTSAMALIALSALYP